MRLLSTVSQQVQTSASAPLIRGSMIMVSPTHQGAAASGPPQEIAADAHPLVSPYASISRPQLKRAISNPIQKKPVEAGKRQYSSYSQGEIVECSIKSFIILAVLRRSVQRLRSPSLRHCAWATQLLSKKCCSGCKP